MFAKVNWQSLRVTRQNHKRFFSTQLSESQKFVYNELIKDRKSPCFEVFSSQIHIIDSPTEYYLALHKLVKESKKRISMSALYIGTGKMEQYLVESINKKIEFEDEIKVQILLDYMRGTRINRLGESSKTLLTPLKTSHQKARTRFGFFHMPDTGILKGKLSESPLREIFGVHHIKAHVFDNNILITGANLSEDYFTDRQDRCMVIQDCAPLANYLDDLITMLTDYSLILDEQGILKTLTPQTPISYQKPRKYKEALAHQLRFLRFGHRTKFSTVEDPEISGAIDSQGEAQEFFAEESVKVKELPEFSDADEFDEEHYLLQDQKAKPIRNETPFSAKLSKFRLDDLKSERKFLTETTGLDIENNDKQDEIEEINIQKDEV